MKRLHQLSQPPEESTTTGPVAAAGCLQMLGSGLPPKLLSCANALSVPSSIPGHASCTWCRNRYTRRTRPARCTPSCCRSASRQAMRDSVPRRSTAAPCPASPHRGTTAAARRWHGGASENFKACRGCTAGSLAESTSPREVAEMGAGHCGQAAAAGTCGKPVGSGSS